MLSATSFRLLPSRALNMRLGNMICAAIERLSTDEVLYAFDLTFRVFAWIESCSLGEIVCSVRSLGATLPRRNAFSGVGTEHRPVIYRMSLIQELARRGTTAERANPEATRMSLYITISIATMLSLGIFVDGLHQSTETTAQITGEMIRQFTGVEKFGATETSLEEFVSAYITGRAKMQESADNDFTPCDICSLAGTFACKIACQAYHPACPYCDVGEKACKIYFNCNGITLSPSALANADQSANLTGQMYRLFTGAKDLSVETDPLYSLVASFMIGEALGRQSEVSDSTACDICGVVGGFACPVACLAFPPVCAFCGLGQGACKAAFHCNGLESNVTGCATDAIY